MNAIKLKLLPTARFFGKSTATAFNMPGYDIVNSFTEWYLRYAGWLAPYITDTALFQEMNAAYRDAFPNVPPARATVRCGTARATSVTPAARPESTPRRANP